MLPDVSTIRLSEQYTMEHEPIASINLMERAATCFVERLCIDNDLNSFNRVLVFCGPGNNGGDGLVIARLLAERNHPVTVVLCHEQMKTTPEFETNLRRLQETTANTVLFSQWDGKATEQSLVIDALFGIGLSRPLEGYFAEVVSALNATKGFIVAVDCPSGLFLEQHTPKENTCVEATCTYTFQFMKEAFLFPENEQRVGQVSVVDIGLQLPEHKGDKHLIDSILASDLLHPLHKFAHKGENGFGLLIAGSYDMPGAAMLGAKSALRSGIGKVMVHSVARVTDLLPIVVPEAVLHTDRNEVCVSAIDLEQLPSIKAIAAGPGLGCAQPTVSLIKNLIDEVQSPLILDADALNILAENKTRLAYLPPYSILTPHRKEFQRLAGEWSNDFDLRDKLRAFAQRYSVIVVLKGAYTAVAMPDGQLYYNTTGNPGMATAGSGDVLTGILLALLSQGYTPVETALLGVYLHGLAGDEALQEQSEQSMTASDITEHLGKAFKKLKSEK